MFSKFSKTIFVLLCLIFITAGTVSAQGGGPPPNKGGGPPSLDLQTVTGTVTYVPAVIDPVTNEEITPAYYLLTEAGGNKYNIDFGPEWYRPDPCLQGELIFREFDSSPLDDEVLVKLGKRELGLFKCTALNNSQCGFVMADGSKYINVNRGHDPAMRYVNLATYVPPADPSWVTENVAVWGRLEEKGDIDLMRAWEIRYDGVWYFWRSEAEPWLMSRFLGCTIGGDE